MSISPFTLCRLKNKERMCYYVMYRDPVTNKRGTKKSVNKLKSKLNLGFEHVSRRDEAMIIAQKALDQGIIFNQRKQLTLNEYLLNFYDFEKSPYFTRKILLDKDSISPDYVSTRRNAVENHIIPLISKDTLVSDINIQFLENVQTQLILKKQLSSTSINQLMNSISQALEYAKKENLLPYSQSTKVEAIRKNVKARGILTNDETKNLMTFLKENNDERVYLAVSLALITGMRSGELRILSREQIKNGLIVVDRAYANIAKTKIPKGKKSRIIPCPDELCEQLINFSFLNPDKKSDLIFWSKKRGKIVSSHYFNSKFTKALIDSNTLTKEQISNRNISFHSLRHMANTLLRGSVDEYILRLTIGHSSEQLSNLYSHIEDSALESLRKAQEKNILPFM